MLFDGIQVSSVSSNPGEPEISKAGFVVSKHASRRNLFEAKFRRPFGCESNIGKYPIQRSALNFDDVETSM